MSNFQQEKMRYMKKVWNIHREKRKLIKTIPQEAKTINGHARKIF